MVSEQKKQTVKELKELINEYPIVGIVDMRNLPAPQLQDLRRSLRDKAKIKMARQTLINRALDDSDKDIDELKDHVKGMAALIFTDENPFKLYKIVEDSTSKAPAKAGQIAPKDIEIEEGKTPFSPGPIISELSEIGLDAGIEEGNVVINQTSVVSEEGEEITPQIAKILGRLDIKPMEVGLKIVAVYEEGTVLISDQLEVDEEEIKGKFKRGSAQARNLSINASYPTEETIKTILQKASNDAKSLAISEDIISEETIERILTKTNAEAESLKEATDSE